MNLHPVFVHFPVALLSLYALMELVRLKVVLRQPYWFYVKALVLMIGGLGALAALYTGDSARFAVSQGEFVPAITNFRQVVSVHENFADATVAIFGILAASYLFLWLARDFSYFRNWQNSFWKFLLKLAHFFVETPFVVLMALAGLICITITGGLGGIMVYGPAADPFFGIVYKILFP